MRLSPPSTACAPSSEPIGMRFTLTRVPSAVFANSPTAHCSHRCFFGAVSNTDLDRRATLVRRRSAYIFCRGRFRSRKQRLLRKHHKGAICAGRYEQENDQPAQKSEFRSVVRHCLKESGNIFEYFAN